MQNEEKTYYTCEACGLKYEEREWRDKCQEWCERTHSCNLEIIEHAVKE
ncbi:hypothetical protein LCGC14_1868260 [marine sediment metagenome]|uniref:Uncharacterized protein n=1 Tax=marine sediment metagenome TaxID=412755 RepID=A0A0F9J4H0_9ZZZZ